MSKRAAILARISDAEADETAGVDDQVKDMRKYVARRGWTLDEAHVLVENDTSAFKRRKIKLPNGRTELRTVRPKFRRALELLETRAVDVLVVLDLDRLARQPRDLEDLIDLVESSSFAVTCESLTGSCQLTSDAGITMARIMCAVANKSSKDTARRVSRARQRQAEEGRFGGGRRPYGFEPDGVTVRPDEAAEIVKMADAFLSGISFREIARDLRERDVPTASGLQWLPTTVRDVLTRPRNAGLMVHKPGEGRKHYTADDVIGRAQWEPIIPEDTLWAIVAKVHDPSRRTNPGPASKWLGSGVYRCPCGEVVRVHSAGDKANRPIYRCQGTGAGHATCPQADLDQLVEGLVIELLSRPDAADLIAAPAVGIDVPALRSELIALRQRTTNLAEDYAEGLIERAAMHAGTKRLQAKIEDIERRLADVAESSPLAPLVTADDAAAAWSGLGIGHRRAVVNTLMTVTLKLVGRGRRPSITERVEIRPKVA